MLDTTFCEKLKNALYHKTLYVMGAFGAPLNNSNKQRYITEYPYNRTVTRKAMINNASDDTFAFDCVCLIKGIMWGWQGLTKDTYGGARYCSAAPSDIDTEQMIQLCRDVSNDFQNITAGELVHLRGHVGVYVGAGLVVECSPAWKNGVQFTNLGNLKFERPEYPTRYWESHGKMPWITYTPNKINNRVLGFQMMSVYDGYKFPKYGIDGEFGNETLSVMRVNLVTANKKNKNTIKYAQKLLGINNENCDGIYGTQTKNYIMKYQKTHNLEVDGIIGVNTWRKLLEV